MNCKNCNYEVDLDYCPSCGQATKLKRIDGHYIIHEIEHVLHFERGILFTVKELCVNPGQTISKYITENRSRLVKPVIFIIITSLFYTLISHFFHIEYRYVKVTGVEKLSIGKILNWIETNYGYANILTGAFIAIWLKIFFKKYGYNFFELLIMLCFVLGISMLILGIFAIIEGIIHIKLEGIAGILMLLYLVWATGSFFEKKKIGSYAKALISYLLGIATFYTIIFVIGITVDTLTKH